MPTAASINLCADSLLLEVAAPAQIISLSWLASDSGLSNYAELARRYPSNRGRAEDLVAKRPDIVFIGPYSSTIEQVLLKRLGIKVVQLLSDESIDNYIQNLQLVGETLERRDVSNALIARLHENIPPTPSGIDSEEAATAIIFQANGYTPGRQSLAGDLLRRAGLQYMASEVTDWHQGRFVSLEELLVQQPEVIIFTNLNADKPALADVYLKHPVLSRALSHNKLDWHPRIIRLQERHLNCGSLSVIDTLMAMSNAMYAR
ncbi:MAG: ABC transporter substrate-binding protein [Pseudomonadota bacterium]